MSEMLERVAKALQKAHYERGRGIAPDWDAIDRFEREMWFFSARAAMVAMREPTEAMKLAPPDINFHPEEAAQAWRAMLDAALTPTSPPT